MSRLIEHLTAYSSFYFPFEHLSHHSETPYQRAIDSFDEYFRLLVLLLVLHRPAFGMSTLLVLSYLGPLTSTILTGCRFHPVFTTPVDDSQGARMAGWL